MLYRRFARLAAAATVLLFPAALSAQDPFSPAKGGYSIVFPEQPQEKQVALSPSVKTTIYSVNHSDAAFLAGFTEYQADMDVEKELVADVENFAAQINTHVTERKRTGLKLADGRRVHEIDFAFEGPQTSGRGILIIPDPRSTIMVAGLSVKPAAEHAAVDDFVKSFKLTGRD